jgi:hypothetical protein
MDREDIKNYGFEGEALGKMFQEQAVGFLKTVCFFDFNLS